MNSCVFCGATDNLTTSMNVTTPRGVIVVHVCGEHEDNASPKKIREVIESKEAALAELEAKCKALGFTMAPIGGSALTVVTAPPPPPIPAAQVLSELRPTRPVKTESKIVQPTSLKVREVDAPIIAVDQSGNKVNLGRENSYDTSKTVKTKDGEFRAPIVVESELQTVEVRGVPMRLPKKIVDDTGGQLNIKVMPTAGASDKFKKGFEDMAARSIANQGPDFSNKGGYENREPRPCLPCGGTGKAKIGDQDCSKCKGTGDII